MFVILEGDMEWTTFLHLFDFANENGLKFTNTKVLQAYCREKVPRRELATQTEDVEVDGDQKETLGTALIRMDVKNFTTKMDTSSDVGDVIFDGVLKTTCNNCLRRRRREGVASGEEAVDLEVEEPKVPVEVNMDPEASEEIIFAGVTQKKTVGNHNTNDVATSQNVVMGDHNIASDEQSNQKLQNPATIPKGDPIKEALSITSQMSQTLEAILRKVRAPKANSSNIGDKARQLPVTSGGDVVAKTFKGDNMPGVFSGEGQMMLDGIIIPRPISKKPVMTSDEVVPSFQQSLIHPASEKSSKIPKSKELTTEVSDQAFRHNIPTVTGLGPKKQVQKRTIQPQEPENFVPKKKKPRVCLKSTSYDLVKPESSGTKPLSALESMISKISENPKHPDTTTKKACIQSQKLPHDSEAQNQITGNKWLPSDVEHIDVIIRKMNSLQMAPFKPVTCKLCCRVIPLCESSLRSVFSLRDHVFGHIKNHPKCPVCSNYHDPSTSARQVCSAMHPHLPLDVFMHQMDYCFGENDNHN